MSRHLSIVCLFVAVVASSAAGEELAVEGNAKVYTGGEGIRVTLVPLAPRDAHHVLIMVEGSDSDLDGKVYLHTVNDSGRGADFTRKLGSRGWNTLTSREGWWSGRYFELFVPGRKDSVHVRYDESDSTALIAGQVLSKYLRERPTGTHALRPELVGRDEGTFGAASGTANTACKSSFSAHIDWKGFPDDVVSNIDIGSRCSDVLRALTATCSDEVSRQAVSKEVKSVTCQGGSTPGVAVKGSQIVFTVTKNEPADVPSLQDAIEHAL
jgi:hypothetical protein